MTELDAARFVRAALRLIVDAVPDSTQVHAEVDGLLLSLERDIAGMDAPPWAAHEGWPETDLPWSTVATADYVQAPNGEWYEVDAWSRTGSTVVVMLKVGDALARSTRSAGERVRVRRGPNGQAIDVLCRVGLSVEVMNR